MYVYNTGSVCVFRPEADGHNKYIFLIFYMVFYYIFFFNISYNIMRIPEAYFHRNSYGENISTLSYFEGDVIDTIKKTTKIIVNYRRSTNCSLKNYNGVFQRLCCPLRYNLDNTYRSIDRFWNRCGIRRQMRKRENYQLRINRPKRYKCKNSRNFTRFLHGDGGFSQFGKKTRVAMSRVYSDAFSRPTPTINISI